MCTTGCPHIMQWGDLPRFGPGAQSWALLYFVIPLAFLEYFMSNTILPIYEKRICCCDLVKCKL